MTDDWQGPHEPKESEPTDRGPTQPTPQWVTSPPPAPTQHRSQVRLPVAVVGLLMVVAVVVGTLVGHGLWSSNGRAASLQGASSRSGGSSNGSVNPASVAAAVDPALVDINVSFSYQRALGAGTGIVLTSNGEVLTNNHVIEGATSIQVTDIGNGKTYSATVAGYDPSADIAVLHLSGASGLQTANHGNSTNLAVGQSVVGLGNAGGVGGTPSSASGAITALDQAITASDSLNGTQEQLSGLIQTDADIQAGDSGGALANSAGQVVGLITAGSSSNSSNLMSATQGYAIPINQAIAIANQIESGYSSSTVHVGPTAFLGVLISTSSQGAPGSTSGNGATISDVVSGGPAAQAGLVAGDIINSVDGQAVTSAESLGSVVAKYSPGTTVQVGWTDISGQMHSAPVQLGSGPAA